MQKTNQKRNSNIELLRVISMLMIVLAHLLIKTSALWEVNSDRPVYYISWLLYALCLTSVNCYVLISGYFGTESRFKFDRLIRIYFQVLFYSVGIAVIMRICHFDLKDGWLNVLLPITRREYWFATVYLGLYCLTPFLNLALKNISEKQLRQLLLVLGVLFCVIPTCLYADNWLEDGGAYGIVWFVFLYLTGGYIKKYYADGRKKSGFYYLISILILPVSKIIVILIGKINIISAMLSETTISKISELLYSLNSLPITCASVFLFLFFCSIEIKSESVSKIINFTGSLTFGIYLIHNNRNLSGPLWEGTRINYWLAEKENIWVILAIWIVVFIVCAAIEWIRQRLFALLRIDKLAVRLADFIQRIVPSA
ncbi:MAG: acyltransferase [Lachnospiraceae bacterium]|nr:acyltransferase [Lachnospiraceae bacterium]